jgi:hypothetical protein
MKRPPDTLADLLYRATFSKDQPRIGGLVDPPRLRKRLMDARRYVLDDGMSAFLSDLASVAFYRHHGSKMIVRMCEQIRISARLPHPAVWIEYNLQAALRRIKELRIEAGIDLDDYDPLAAPEREGWLIERHPGIETACRLQIFNWARGGYGDTGIELVAFPVAYAWTSDDSPLPWRPLVSTASTLEASGLRSSSELYTGVIGYHSDKIAVVTSDASTSRGMKTEAAIDLIREWTGTMRRVWALLTTLTDIPVSRLDVRATRGFMGKRQYHKFLDHSVLTLRVPQRQTTVKLARSLIAAARRRAHSVSGHWRKDHRHRGSANCHHEWDVDGVCQLCGGHRLWIREHVRGDASLGFVSHDYAVTHEGDKR